MKKKILGNKKQNILVILWIVICAIGALTCIKLLSTPDISIKIIFDTIKENDKGCVEISIDDKTDIYYADVNDEAYKKFELEIPLNNSAVDINDMKITLNVEEDTCGIKCIEVSNHSVQMIRIAPTDISKYFVISNENYYQSPCIIINSETGIVQLEATQKFIDIYRGIKQNTAKININVFVWTILICSAGIYCFARKKNIVYTGIRRLSDIMKRLLGGYTQNFYKVANVFVIITGVLVFIMAVKSHLYAHPDENVTKLAIDYYMGGWFKPGLRGQWALGTFSNYGVSRLEEASLYYLFAGKIAWLFKEFVGITTYYRMFNVILFWIMIGLVIKYGKDNMWMYLILFFTPQLWYLFSYATSDAWDFFWAFIIVFLIARSDSILNKLLDNHNKIMGCIIPLVGIVFALIFQGKQNYYIILLLAFGVFLEKLIRTNKENRKFLITKYILILVCCFSFLFIKQELDKYSVSRDVVYIQEENIAQSNAEASLKNAGDMQNNMRLYQKGVSLEELFKEYETGKWIYISFIGDYGWLQFYGSESYRVIVSALYTVLLLLVICAVMRSRDLRSFVWTILCILLCCISFGLVIYMCWFVDYQPQGRYMMPIIPVLGYMISSIKKLQDACSYKIVLTSCYLACIYSFIYVGLSNLI